MSPRRPREPRKGVRRGPFRQSESTINYSVKEDEEIVDITNVAYELSGTDVPGRPRDQRPVLRQTTRMKQVLGDKGMDATVTLDVWPLGADLKQKPLYTTTVTGTEAHTTCAPLRHFSISREFVTERYAGFEAPPDDSPDARLNEAHVVGVLTYASEDRVIREALITW